jgi:hypothetical protein
MLKHGLEGLGLVAKKSLVISAFMGIPPGGHMNPGREHRAEKSDPSGSQQAFLTGLAHLYNLIPYQRRAQHAGQCGVEVEGGRVPTADWILNLQILTSGGFR